MRTIPSPSARRRSRKTRTIAGVSTLGSLVLLLVGFGFASATQPSSPAQSAANTPTSVASDASSSGATSTDAAATGEAFDVLASLPVKGKAPGTGYARTADFGSAWLDVDHNGCDTRNDILDRDLTEVVKQGTCKVVRGTLADAYTGATIDFVRGNTTSALVQIDHIVPLQNAWITGAQQLTRDQRISLANDPLNLIAVDGRSNEQKSSGDAATWLPANKSFRCEYVSRQISVKAAYGLWVTRAEHDAMTRVLAGCPDRVAP